MRHFNIPIFIPGLACPFNCIFCDQKKISGHSSAPSATEVNEVISRYLAFLPEKDRRIEVAFFGGSFTGLPLDMQREYLFTASKWAEKGMIDGIRLSTRPDFISDEILDALKDYPVTCIELGAQSLDDDVLKRSGRGHTAMDVEVASEKIRVTGIELGLQMMIGLPGDSPEKSMITARKIALYGAGNTRIYPALVIKGTPLENLYRKGRYQPLTLEETVEQCADLLEFFEEKDIRVLRLGLHPSYDLLYKGDLIAGPWHPALKELSLTQLWNRELKKLTINKRWQKIQLRVPPQQLNVAIGHRAGNKKMLEEHYKKVVFTVDNQLKKREYHVDPC